MVNQCVTWLFFMIMVVIVSLFLVLGAVTSFSHFSVSSCLNYIVLEEFGLGDMEKNKPDFFHRNLFLDGV